jgi:hypothetical protein
MCLLPLANAWQNPKIEKGVQFIGECATADLDPNQNGMRLFHPAEEQSPIALLLARGDPVQSSVAPDDR